MSGAFLWASAPRRQWLHHVIAADLLAAHSCSTPSQKVLLLDSHLVTVEVTELQIYQTTGYVSQSPTVRSWWVCVHRSLIFLFLADRSGRCSWFASRFDMFVLRSFPPPSSVLKSGCLSHPSFSPYLQHSLTVLLWPRSSRRCFSAHRTAAHWVSFLFGSLLGKNCEKCCVGKLSTCICSVSYFYY